MCRIGRGVVVDEADRLAVVHLAARAVVRGEAVDVSDGDLGVGAVLGLERVWPGGVLGQEDVLVQEGPDDAAADRTKLGNGAGGVGGARQRWTGEQGSKGAREDKAAL